MMTKKRTYDFAPTILTDELKHIRSSMAHIRKQEREIIKKMQLYCPHKNIKYKLEKLPLPDDRYIGADSKSTSYKRIRICLDCGKVI